LALFGAKKTIQGCTLDGWDKKTHKFAIRFHSDDFQQKNNHQFANPSFGQ